MKNNKQKKKLSKEKLKEYEILSNSSFCCDFWRLVNLKIVLKELISYIRYLEDNKK